MDILLLLVLVLVAGGAVLVGAAVLIGDAIEGIAKWPIPWKRIKDALERPLGKG